MISVGTLICSNSQSLTPGTGSFGFGTKASNQRHIVRSNSCAPIARSRSALRGLSATRSDQPPATPFILMTPSMPAALTVRISFMM